MIDVKMIDVKIVSALSSPVFGLDNVRRVGI